MSDRLDKYNTPPSYSPLEKKELPKLVEKVENYEAFIKAKGMERVEALRLEYGQGNFDFFHYNHLLEGSYQDNVMTLTTSSRIYAITGQNLDQMAELLTDRKIKILREFDPAQHEMPANKKAVIIEKIERMN